MKLSNLERKYIQRALDAAIFAIKEGEPSGDPAIEAQDRATIMECARAYDLLDGRRLGRSAR